MRPTDKSEAYMLSERRRGKGLGLSEGRKVIHRKMEKSKCLVHKYLLGCTETMGHRGI